MTCKDCIYSPICKLYADFGVTDVPYDENDVCKLFRSKIDVVEVVRCRDCSIGKGNTPKMGAGWVYCINNDQYHKETHFCSYGERRSK